MWKCPVCSAQNKDGTYACRMCQYDIRNEASSSGSRRSRRTAADEAAKKAARESRSTMLRPDNLSQAVRDTFQPSKESPVIESGDELEDLPPRRLHRHERPAEESEKRSRRFAEDENDSLLRAGKQYTGAGRIRPQHILALLAVLAAVAVMIIVFTTGKGHKGGDIINPAAASAGIDVISSGNTADTGEDGEYEEEISSAGDVVVEELFPIILFGKYEWDNDEENGPDSIPWYIVEDDGEKMLLVSQYGLILSPFFDNLVGYEWSRSPVREYLNDDFYVHSFDSAERERILYAVTQDTIVPGTEQDDEPTHSTLNDYVFLLSIEEAEKYFPDNEHRLCFPSEYVNANGSVRASNQCAWWWLRDSGDAQKDAVVTASGAVYPRGYSASLQFGIVRPAIWISHYEDYPIPTPVPTVTPAPLK